MRIAFSIFGLELWALDIDGIGLVEELVECGDGELEDEPPFGFHLGQPDKDD